MEKKWAQLERLVVVDGLLFPWLHKLRVRRGYDYPGKYNTQNVEFV